MINATFLCYGGLRSMLTFFYKEANIRLLYTVTDYESDDFK